MKHNERFLAPLALVVFLVAVPALAAQVNPQLGQQQSVGSGSQQAGMPDDPIRQLNLTAEQREQIRSIREQSKNERMAINQRVAEANRALELALDAENPDETLVDQRVREVAAAQASAMRMRILTEVKIRRVLTDEQRMTLRSLQKQARETRRERQLNGTEERQLRRQERKQGIQNQRNGIAPLLQRRGLQRRPRL